jgi:hypothetical protein
MAEDIGRELIPVFNDLVGTLSKDLLPAIMPLLPPLTELLKGILEKIVEIMPTVIPLFVRIAEVFLKIFEALEPLIGPLVEIAFVILDGLLDAIEPLIPSLVTLGEEFGRFLVALMPIIEPVVKLISLFLELGGEVFLDLLIRSLQIVTPALEILGAVLEWLVGLVEKVVNWFKELFGVTSKGGKELENTANSISGSKPRSGSSSSSSSSGGSSSSSSSNFGGSSSNNNGFIFPSADGVIHLNDFILTKSGQIINTNPKDNLIGVQDMDSLGGGGGVVINIERIYGVDADDISNALQKKLNNLIRR